MSSALSKACPVVWVLSQPKLLLIGPGSAAYAFLLTVCPLTCTKRSPRPGGALYSGALPVANSSPVHDL